MAGISGGQADAAAAVDGACIIDVNVGSDDALKNFEDELREKALDLEQLTVVTTDSYQVKVAQLMAQTTLPRLKNVNIYLASFKKLVRGSPLLEEVTLASVTPPQVYKRQMEQLAPLKHLKKVNMKGYLVEEKHLMKLLKGQSRETLVDVVVGVDGQAWEDVKKEVEAINKPRIEAARPWAQETATRTTLSFKKETL